MKKLIFCLLVLIGSGIQNLTAQTRTIHYSYDDAGNRTYRGSVFMSTKKSGSVGDSTNSQKVESEEQIFEEKKGEQKVTIYPNPTRGELKIKLEGFEEANNSFIYLYNLKGALIIKKVIESSEEMIDITSYPLGTYVLKIITGDKKFEWKVIKE